MRRPLPLDPRGLIAAALATLLAASLASACPDSKSGVSASTPSVESDAVIAASTNCPEQAVEATAAVAPPGLVRFRDGDHRSVERALIGLLAQAPKASAKAANDHIARVSERRSGS